MDKLARFQEQLARGMRTVGVIPYFLLSRGPTPNPCPLHGEDENLLLAIDDPYWRAIPLGGHPECRCYVRGVSRREYARLVADGVRDRTPQLDAEGRPTGQLGVTFVPVKLQSHRI